MASLVVAGCVIQLNLHCELLLREEEEEEDGSEARGSV